MVVTRTTLTLVHSATDTDRSVHELQVLIHQYLASRVALGTYSTASLASVRSRLESFDAHYAGPVAAIGWREVEEWVASLQGLEAASRNSYLSSLRRFCKWLVREGILTNNPAADIDPVPQPRRLPRGQSHAAVAAIFGACRDDRDIAMIRLMVSSGLRRKEVAGADWPDYDRDREELFIASGKGRHERIVPITRATSAALARLEPHRTGPIIRSIKAPHGRLTPGGVGKHAAGIMTRAGVKVLPFDGKGGHSLRHTAATELLDSSENLKYVQDLLGHADLSTTGIYLGTTKRDKMRAAMELRDLETEFEVPWATKQRSA